MTDEVKRDLVAWAIVLALFAGILVPVLLFGWHQPPSGLPYKPGSKEHIENLSGANELKVVMEVRKHFEGKFRELQAQLDAFKQQLEECGCDPKPAKP